MNDLLKILVPYLIGVMISYYVFNPTCTWRAGYEAAKKIYSDWVSGWNAGFDSAKKIYTDYNRGFGEGFELGWDAAADSLQNDYEVSESE